MHDRLEAVCQGRLADDDARHALFEAEAFTQTLRRSVQTAHAEQQLRQRFDAALRQALATEAIALGGTTLRDFRHGTGELGCFEPELRVYDRADLPCLACGTPIRHLVQGQRSTYFCPSCQR